MGDIKIDIQTGDLIIMDGDISICRLQDSLTQAGNIAIRTPYGENNYHDEYGNKLWSSNRVKTTNTPLVESLCRDAIMSSNSEIVDVKDIHVTFQNNSVLTTDYKISMSDIEKEQEEDVVETDEEEIVGDDDDYSDFE